jgi:hypothetical protein
MTFIFESGKQPQRYVYLVEAYRDVLGRPRNHRVRIGRVDPETGARVLSELALEDGLEGIKLTSEMRESLSESIRHLKEHHPEILQRYDEEGILGRTRKGRAQFPFSLRLNELRSSRAESYGPVILRELIADETGLGKAMAACFPKSHRDLLDLSSSLAFDPTRAHRHTWALAGGLGSIAGEAGASQVADFYKAFGEGRRGAGDLLVEANGRTKAGIVLPVGCPWPVFLGPMGPAPGGAGQLPAPPLFLALAPGHPGPGGLEILFSVPEGSRPLVCSPYTPALASVVRDRGGALEVVGGVAPSDGELLASSRLDVSGRALYARLFHGRLASPGRGGDGPGSRGSADSPMERTLMVSDSEEGAFSLRQVRSAIYLQSVYGVLERRLEAIELLGAEIPAPGRDLVLFLGSVFAVRFHDAYLSVKSGKDSPLEAALDEFRALTRLSINEKSLLTHPGKVVSEILAAMGVAKERLHGLDRGIDPLEGEAQKDG